MSHILLLEPNRLMAKQHVAFLKQMGHDVIWHENAQSAISAADNTKPDVVIVELLLAGHSGIEFLYEFRSYGDWQKVPVIILSSVTQAEAAVPDQTLQELGVVSYLYKSQTSLDKLNSQIEKALES